MGVGIKRYYVCVDIRSRLHSVYTGVQEKGKALYEIVVPLPLVEANIARSADTWQQPAILN